MDRTVSQLYAAYREDTGSIIKKSLEAGLSARPASSPATIFFRADDIGVPSAAFSRLIRLFKEKEMPLCLAVVPAWLTPDRWAAIENLCDRDSSLWCWHQHGWRHKNHEVSGKKCEFGMTRPAALQRADLLRGKVRLQMIMGAAFSPYFTPPWNRCSPSTIDSLVELGFHGLSRSSSGAQESHTFPEMSINVDLHTRKEPDGPSCLAGLRGELERAARSGCIGIMLHHQRMNEHGFTLLGQLLDMVNHHPLLVPVSFPSLTLSG